MLITLIFFLLGLGPSPILCRDTHVINFRSPNLYPESLAWNPRAQHFLIGSLRRRIITAVSDAGVVETFISDITLPSNSSILGLAVDSHSNRLLAVVHSPPPLPPFNALAAYDLRSRRGIFISLLPDSDDESSLSAANDVAVDHTGNAYVTNSAGNFIWKITTEGTASIFSKSPLFTSPENNQVITGENLLGLNGITYVSKGYLLVVQSSTGKVFKVDTVDGTARTVSLNENLIGVRDDNAAVADRR